MGFVLKEFWGCLRMISNHKLFLIISNPNEKYTAKDQLHDI